MNDEQFWSIIGTSKKLSSGDMDIQMETLEKELPILPKSDLEDFANIYNGYRNKAHHWDLWAAAYIINGGCSDDGFEYFKDWLISQGSAVYQNALNDPETLAGIAIPYETEFEPFGYIVRNVYESKFGMELPCSVPLIENPQGKEWDEDTVEDKYPKLAAWMEDQ